MPIRGAPFGMSRAQWAVLKRLELNEGLKQSELAEMLDLQPITLTRLLDRLCDNGLIERRPDPNDRRAKRLYLTPAARPLMDALRAVQELMEPCSTASIRAAVACMLDASRDCAPSAAGSRSPTRNAQEVKHYGGTLSLKAESDRRRSPTARSSQAISAQAAAHDPARDPAADRARVGASSISAGGRYISTDNAYVGAQKVLITPDISGKIVAHHRARRPARQGRRRTVRDRSRAVPLAVDQAQSQARRRAQPTSPS